MDQIHATYGVFKTNFEYNWLLEANVCGIFVWNQYLIIMGNYLDGFGWWIYRKYLLILHSKSNAEQRNCKN